VGARGHHGQAGREQRGGADAGDDLAGPQHRHASASRRRWSRRQQRDRLAEREHERAAGQQPLAAEQVAEHPEGQLEQAHRD